jgi:hypothetical protein
MNDGEMITADPACVEAASAYRLAMWVVIEQAFRWLRATRPQEFEIVWKQFVGGSVPWIADIGLVCHVYLIDNETGAEHLIADFPVRPFPPAWQKKGIDACVANYKKWGGK